VVLRFPKDVLSEDDAFIPLNYWHI